MRTDFCGMFTRVGLDEYIHGEVAYQVKPFLGGGKRENSRGVEQRPGTT